ncbi:hypothetical protein AQ490_26360 [Wenjunlia vitaminophila]|uniref:Uncharacterized protein n=1 Tax=Wenjunlia vitaminophila TaxID=76728 RepID=A0A0T6LQG9_WENVI|nr:hypothetical protein [Wenjunlia vitaminophila]KRV48185.1 hypothetical protein AQ490_26360 [Wenjunlia vitaminophila]
MPFSGESLLVVTDDVRLVAPTAFPALPERTAWLVATRTVRPPPPLEAADRLRLAPLSRAAVEELGTDLIGTRPAQDLLALVVGAGGPTRWPPRPRTGS